MLPKLFLVITIIALTGCSSHYVAPAGGVSPAALSDVSDINANFAKKPAATFPARIAIARIQDSGYTSSRCTSFGRGRYSVVTSREAEADADITRLTQLPSVAGIAVMSRLLILPELKTDRELRIAASKLQADMVLVYSFDVSFRVAEHEIGPLGILTLGMLPNHEAKVTSVCSAALFDVRTGFIYATAESSADVSQLASAWTSSSAVDESRIKAQRESFKKMIPELEKAWTGVVHSFASAAVSR